MKVDLLPDKKRSRAYWDLPSWTRLTLVTNPVPITRFAVYSHHFCCLFQLFFISCLLFMCILKAHQHVKWSEVELHSFTNGDRQLYVLMPCGDCGYQTTSHLSLDKHIKEKHSVALETPAAKKDLFKFRCDLCPYKARLKREFEQHSACHRNQAAQYQCPLCSFSVDRIGHLNRHLKLHSGETGENKNSHNTGVHQQVTIFS